MPKRSNIFQQLILEIEKTLTGISNSKITESKLLIDTDGIEREIDIFIESEINKIPMTIAIECRDHSRDQSVVWIDELIGKYATLKIDKVVAVSSTGFSENALKKANRSNIIALSLEEANSADWNAYFSEYLIRSYRLELKILSIQIGFDPELKLDGGSLSNNFDVYDDKFDVISNINQEIDLNYESMVREYARTSLKKNRPDFFESGESKGLIVPVKCQFMEPRFMKSESGAIHRLDWMEYYISAEIYFYETENTLKTYKDNAVIEIISETDGITRKAYGIPYTSNSGVEIKVLGDRPVWRTRYESKN